MTLRPRERQDFFPRRRMATQGSRGACCMLLAADRDERDPVEGVGCASGITAEGRGIAITDWNSGRGYCVAVGGPVSFADSVGEPRG